MSLLKKAAERVSRLWTCSLRPRTPARRDGFRFDAFVSYANADAATARWLHGVLSRFWVPGFGRRKVFLDEANLVPGLLEEGLREALKASATLVVCWSEQTWRSSYVALEIDAFLETHTPEDIVVCLVGAQHRDLPPPPTRLTAVAALTTHAKLMPDLRGYVAGRRVERHLRLAALSVLAAVLRLPDKGALLDRRKKAFILVGGATAFCLLLATAWVVWTRTDLYQRNAIVADLRGNYDLWQDQLVPVLEPSLACLEARGYRSLETFVLAFDVEPLRSKLAGTLVRELARQGNAAAATKLLGQAIEHARAVAGFDVRADAFVALATRVAGVLPPDLVGRLAADAAATSRGEGDDLAHADRLGRLLPILPPEVAATEATMVADALAKEGDGELLRRAVSAVAPMLRAHASQAQLDRLAEKVTNGMAVGDPVLRWGVEAEAAVTLGRLGFPNRAHEVLQRAIADARLMRSLPVDFALRGIVTSAGAEPRPAPEELVPDLAAAVAAISRPSYRASAAADLAALVAPWDPNRAALLAAEAVAKAREVGEEDRVSVLAEVATTLEAADLSAQAHAAATAIFEALSSGTGQVTQPESAANAALILAADHPDRAKSILTAATAFARPGDERTLAAVRSATAALAARLGDLRSARLIASSIPLRRDRLRAYAAVACGGVNDADRAVAKAP